MTQGSDGGDGCFGCVVGVLAIAAVFAALISIAALVDPFDWMPSVGEVWADCEEEPRDEGPFDSGEDPCDLDVRFPGFYGHAALNLLWTTVTAIALAALIGAAGNLRSARRARFNTGKDFGAEYDKARSELIGLAVIVTVLVAIPLVAVLA